METDSLIIEPFSQSLTEVSVSAVLRYDRPARAWEVIVALSYAPDRNSVNGDEIDAQLFDTEGTPLKLAERPSGQLPGAGGSLGMSSNARFLFQESAATPGELHVTYRGETARFKVIPGETS
jgi:hypothetical protein